jgi:hypothetical protein
MTEKTHIRLFITKTNKFRAEIKEPNNTYQVTVGGYMWKRGKGAEYSDIILSKIEQRLKNLTEQFGTIKYEKSIDSI